MKNKISKYLLVDLVFILLLFQFAILGDLKSIVFGKILIIIAILSNIQLMYRYKQHDFIVIFLIFSIFYWIYLLPYYYFRIPYHYLLEYQKIDYTNFIVFMQLLFLRIMFLGINPKKIITPKNGIIYRNNNIVFFIFSSVIIILIPIILITTPLTLSHNYSIESKSSILLEYVIIFIIIASIYANTSIKRYYIIVLSMIYMVLPLLYGKRLAFLMIILLIFNLFFTSKFKLRYILMGVIIGFIFIRVYAGIRIGMENINLSSFLLGVSDDGVMSNNQGGVIVCSVTYYGLIENGIFDFMVRLKSLIGTLIGTVLPSSFNFEEAYINLYTMKYAQIPGNGGLTSIYLYIWGGYLGVLIGGLIFNYLIRNSQKSRLLYIYIIFVFATYPRWYAYNMFILLKMGFWLMFFLAIADTINKYTKRRYV